MMDDKKKIYEMTIDELNKDKEEYIQFANNAGSEPSSNMLSQYEILTRLEEIRELVKLKLRIEKGGFYFSQRRAVEEKLKQIINIIP